MDTVFRDELRDQIRDKIIDRLSNENNDSSIDELRDQIKDSHIDNVINQIKADFNNLFPELDNNLDITSPSTPDYNCIAWAAGDITQWWWPSLVNGKHFYWPEGVEKKETLECFIKAFKGLGYVVCDSCELEDKYERIAIFTDASNTPTHAARQEASGKWISKIGNHFDIKHNLEGLCGEHYGNVAVIMKRPRFQ